MMLYCHGWLLATQVPDARATAEQPTARAGLTATLRCLARCDDGRYTPGDAADAGESPRPTGRAGGCGQGTLLRNGRGEEGGIAVPGVGRYPMPVRIAQYMQRREDMGEKC